MKKGHVFTDDDLSSYERRTWSPEKKARWRQRQTDRYRIVAMNGNMPIIAEELDARSLAVLSPKARRVAGAMLSLDPATRLEIIAAFNTDGGLKIPFKMV